MADDWVMKKRGRGTRKNAYRCCRLRAKHPDKKHSQRGLSSKSRPAHRVCLSWPLTCELRRRESSSSRCFFYYRSGPPPRPSLRPNCFLNKKRRGEFGGGGIQGTFHHFLSLSRLLTMPPEQRTANAQKGQKKWGQLLIWCQPQFGRREQRGGNAKSVEDRGWKSETRR